MAEKPSVARDIAGVLGASKSGSGFLEGSGYIVTWAIGHLVALAQPHQIEAAWKSWRRDLLPMLPKAWPLVINEKTRDQFEIVRKVLNSAKVDRIVCATDAGREGELIFRYIYDAAECKKPFDRLWISSLTPDAIRNGFGNLKPGKHYDPLADAAVGRSRADWLVGMNLSRAYSLALNEEISVGRVQTPTLAMVVERELAIQRFVPEDYVEVSAVFHPADLPAEERYTGMWFRHDAPDLSADMGRRLPADGVEAKAIVERAKTGTAKILSIDKDTQRTLPPLMYDLTELQRHANRLFGFSAQKTLDLAQALYERNKLISYPRTDCRHLSKDVSATLPQIVPLIKTRYAEQLAPGTGDRPLSRRYVDDSKVTDHHAIIPTSVNAAKLSLTEEQQSIYDLICRRLLSAWQDDHVVSVTRVVTGIRNGAIEDHYETSGTSLIQLGWKVLDVKPARRQTAESEAAPSLPAALSIGQAQEVLEATAKKKTTRPPKRFTEATLLTAMETAGQTLDEKDLSDAMKQTGLGTPATRAAIIETLLTREYLVRDGKSLAATPKGIHLIQVVHPEVKSPAMTGQWEKTLRRIHEGKAQLSPFLEEIQRYVTEVVGKVDQEPRHVEQEAIPTPTAQPVTIAPDATLREVLTTHFGHADFRPHQEDVCNAVMQSRDVLLVMATGAGKSLCYQLPAVARGGTALVISPLIALMDDQVAILRRRGFSVEAIHSGIARQRAREVCQHYLEGNLQFLFVAPERFRVSGFPAMLSKRRPSLIAVDEAHCISQWGHDFRPDYRMLGQHLPGMRPAPVIALTATATVQVQQDIVDQLHLHEPVRFIHGFRRDNIAIEILDIAPSERTLAALKLLRDPQRLPAIIYVPSRKECESVASEFRYEHKSGAYHAGLDAKKRSQVQTDFLEGTLDVLVATIAFGMGIDKPNVRTIIHTALPGSLEGYYQEIGRAGRDGLPSRAILMQSYADRHTHDFFFERDYPDVGDLDQIYRVLNAQPMAKEELKERVKLTLEVFEKALEKLWAHGGAGIDYEDNVTRGETSWRSLYQAQVKSKIMQIEQVIRYAQSPYCRMQAVVRHFGDREGSRAKCGICDTCAPKDCIAQQFRIPNEREQAAAYKILSALEPGCPKSTGKLHVELFSNDSVRRREFEELLAALARSGFITFEDRIFDKDGKQIPYRVIHLTQAGLAAAEAGDAEFLMKGGESPAVSKPKSSGRTKAARKQESKVITADDEKIQKALRAWRLAEAKKRGVPAFRILTDQALAALAEDRPANDEDLLTIKGIGLATVTKYGADLLRILAAGN